MTHHEEGTAEKVEKGLKKGWEKTKEVGRDAEAGLKKGWDKTKEAGRDLKDKVD
jgi:hypothetical protein